jgi:hypothetical protein
MTHATGGTVGKNAPGLHEIRLQLLDAALDKSDDIIHEHQIMMALAQVNQKHDLYRRVITLHEQMSLYIGMIRVTRPGLSSDLDHNSKGWKSVTELVDRLLKMREESEVCAKEAAEILEGYYPSS